MELFKQQTSKDSGMQNKNCMIIDESLFYCLRPFSGIKSFRWLDTGRDWSVLLENCSQRLRSHYNKFCFLGTKKICQEEAISSTNEFLPDQSSRIRSRIKKPWKIFVRGQNPFMTLINGPGRGGQGAGGTPLYKLIYRIKISRMSANKIFMFLITPLAEMLKCKTCIVVLWKKERGRPQLLILTYYLLTYLLYLLAIYG